LEEDLLERGQGGEIHFCIYFLKLFTHTFVLKSLVILKKFY